MRMRLVSGTTVATGLALVVTLVLAGGCETGSDGPAPGEPAADRGTVPPIAERGQRFPRPVPRPAPVAAATATPATPAPATQAAAPAVPTKPPAGAPGVHTVARGENVYDIARQYDVDAYAIVVSNELRAPFDLTEGQVLIIPGSRAASAYASKAPVQPDNERTPERTTEQQAAERAAERPNLDRPAVDRPVERSGAADAAEKDAEGEAASLPPAQPEVETPPSKEGFVWPVTGRVVSSYGPKGGGRYNDGINIAAPEGSVVRAAESGVVAYAGNELRGFGRTLLLKHPGGWVTAYAHNSELLVRRGEKVRRGQPVARVGSTGGVDQSQLHFEIRRGRKAVDPAKLLPRPSAARERRSEG